MSLPRDPHHENRAERPPVVVRDRRRIDRVTLELREPQRSLRPQSPPSQSGQPPRGEAAGLRTGRSGGS